VHVSDPHNNELTDPTTVFRTERFTDPRWPRRSRTGSHPHHPPIPLDPIPAGVYQQRHAQAAQALAHVIAPPVRPTVPPTPYPDLATGAALKPAKAPTAGWRKWLYLLSGRLINVGDGPHEARYNSLIAQANRPLTGCYRIALLAEGRRRQDHHHRDARRHVRLHPR
jgi:hypothetical protein